MCARGLRLSEERAREQQPRKCSRCQRRRQAASAAGPGTPGPKESGSRVVVIHTSDPDRHARAAGPCESYNIKILTGRKTHRVPGADLILTGKEQRKAGRRDGRPQGAEKQGLSASDTFWGRRWAQVLFSFPWSSSFPTLEKEPSSPLPMATWSENTAKIRQRSGLPGPSVPSCPCTCCSRRCSALSPTFPQCMFLGFWADPSQSKSPVRHFLTSCGGVPCGRV